MLCSKCGNPIRNDERSCSHCGAQLEYYIPEIPSLAYSGQVRPTQPEPQKPKKHTALVIVIAVIMSLFILGANLLAGFAAIQLSRFIGSYEVPGSMPNDPTKPTVDNSMQLAADYEGALRLMNNGDYDAAIIRFRNLGNYRDSKEKVSQCAYLAASQCLDRGDYTAIRPYLHLLDEEKRAIIDDRYYGIIQSKATDLISQSLATNFRELLKNTPQLPYDPELKSHYLDVYNNTIYHYSLSYRIVYYDRSGNVIQTSQELTAQMQAAYITRVPLPVEDSLVFDHYDVQYQALITREDIDRSPVYAVRFLDKDGNPIYRATIGHLEDTGTMSNTDFQGIASHHSLIQGKTFRVYVSHNPDYQHEHTIFEFPLDGWVYDAVVLPQMPDYTVTVVDTDGDPIPGVTMQLATVDVFTGSKYGKTDKNGYACWYHVDQQYSYKLTSISLPGFVTIEEILYEPGENHMTVVLEKVKPSKDTPDYTVTVVDSQGNPIAGVVLYLTASDVFTGHVYGKTDRNGVASWYDVDLEYAYKVVRISKDGFVSIEEVCFPEGEYHLQIVLEEEESEA